MFYNLLLTDPDDIPDGYTTINAALPLTLILTITAAAFILIAAIIIYNLYKYYENKPKTWVKPTIVIATLIVEALIITLGCVIISKF